MVVDFVDNGELVDPLANSAYDPNFTWWKLNGITSETPPMAFNYNEWSWSVQARPKLEVKDIAYDKYDEHGFVGRFIDQSLNEKKKDQSRLLYTFSKTVPGGGAGGGTPGGGGS